MTDHLTDSERALHEAAKKATKGEWQRDGGAVVIDTREQVCCGRGYLECCGEPDVRGGLELVAESNETDAAYIVAAQPQRVIGLLDEIERLRGALYKIADERMYRSGYCQTDIAVEPALTASEAQGVARAAMAAGEIAPKKGEG